MFDGQDDYVELGDLGEHKAATIAFWMKTDDLDAAPGVISFVVDGVLADGGDARAYGWHRYSGVLGDVSGSSEIRLSSSFRGRVKKLRIYDRYLRTSEAIANFHAGP